MNNETNNPRIKEDVEPKDLIKMQTEVGGLLPSSTMYSSTPVCVTGSNYTWPCTAGQTVVGFLNEYNVDGHQNGLFKYQNTSTNSPWNTMSVQISIL